MADIFLSYTERDRETARRLADALGNAGWSVWWDRRIPAGETWRNVLQRALEDMRCMVVIWSAKSIESEWVCEEATEGRRLGRLVPVLIEPVRPPAGFREIQAADLTGWNGSPDCDGLRMLLSDLEHFLGRPKVEGASGTLVSEHQQVKNPVVVGETMLGAKDEPGFFQLTDPDAHAQRSRWTYSALAVGGALAMAAVLFGISTRWRLVDEYKEPNLEPFTAQPKESTPPASPADLSKTLSPPQVAPPDVAPSPVTAATAAPTLSTESKKQTEPATALATKRSVPTRSPETDCSDLLIRMQLGEALSEPSQTRFNKECQP